MDDQVHGYVVWGVRGVQLATEPAVDEPADVARVDVDLVVVPLGDVEVDLLGRVIRLTYIRG